MNLTKTRTVVVFVGALLVTSAAGRAAGQIVHDVNPSVRAAGMGRVSTAAFWDPAGASWKNPAILGYQRGVEYVSGAVDKWFPDASEARFAADRVVVGGCGLGLNLNGWPLKNLGGHRYEDDGDIETFGAGGEPGSDIPHRYEDEVHTVGIGVSVGEFLRFAVPPLSSVMGGLLRFGDLSIGMAVNEIETESQIGASRLSSEAETRNLGVLARITVYNSVNESDAPPDPGAFLNRLLGGVRVDAAYGYSVHNYDEAVSTSSAEWVGGFRLAESTYHGAALHLSTGLPRCLWKRLDSGPNGWLARSLAPIISWSFGWDREEYTHFHFGEPRTGTIDEFGSELTIANIFMLRRGEIDDPGGGRQGSTSGWGLGFRVGEYGGFRYDEATLPLNLFDHQDQTWRGWAMFVHPLAVWRATQG